MRKHRSARFVNGVLTAAAIVLLAVHAALGSLSAVTGLSRELLWMVWGAVGLVVAHVVASVVTSREQLTDAERPPSARKKRHLALKWVTGGSLAIAVVAHIFLPHDGLLSLLVVVAVCLALAVHLCVGARSLLKDLGLDRRYKTAFRVVVCVFLFACALVMIVGGA